MPTAKKRSSKKSKSRSTAYKLTLFAIKKPKSSKRLFKNKRRRNKYSKKSMK